MVYRGNLAEKWGLGPARREPLAGCPGFYVRLNEDLRKTVVFFGFEDSTPGKGGIACVGTGFLLKYDNGGYLVTAKHLAHNLGDDPFLVRLNKKDGTSENIPADSVRWYGHPDPGVDVAVTPFNLKSEAPYDAVYMPDEMLVTDALKHAAGVKVLGIGDLTYVIGLFRLMSGEKRNLPMVHSGCIAMMPEDERIPIRDWRDKSKRIFVEGYLVEAHALDGLSGSPVLVRPTVDVDVSPRNVLLDPRNAKASEFRAVAPTARVFLLGLWSGSWDAPADEVVSVQTGKGARVSVGVGVVVAASKIKETLDIPELVKARDEVKKQREEKIHAAEPDSAISAARSRASGGVPPAKDENPQHQEDFTSLIDEAARKQKQGG